MRKKENPGTTVAAVAGAEETKAREDLLGQNINLSVSCQSASVQRARILGHLQHDTLTTLQAREMGIMHPAARCMELRRQGFEIVTEWTNEYCAGGVRHRVAKYLLLPARQTTLFDLMYRVTEGGGR